MPAAPTLSGLGLGTAATHDVEDFQAAFTAQNANKVFAGPATGADGAPGFRALVPADIPALNYDPAGTAATAITAETTRAEAAEALLIPLAQKAANSGVATLDINGKLTGSQIPASIMGALEYQGTWDCSGGSYPASPSKGWYWICSVAGTISGTAYAVHDWLVYDGTSWDLINNQTPVLSVAGKAGTVTLTVGDIQRGNGKQLIHGCGYRKPAIGIFDQCNGTQQPDRLELR